MSDFISVVWFTTKPCGTHFRLPHHLAYIHWTGRAPLNYEPSGCPFPPISPKNIWTRSMKGSPLNMSEFISEVFFTKKRCGSHFRLPHHLAYIHWTGRAPLKFEPSGPPFPPIPSKNIYTNSIEGSPMSKSDSISVVWFILQPCGTHFRSPHHLAYLHWTGRASSNSEPSGHPFPPISPKNNHTHFSEGSPLSMSDSIPVFCSTPQPCGTHFRLPHHLAYIH